MRELAQRIRWEPLANARFPERFEAAIRCELRSGARQAVRIDDVFGNHTRPAAAEAILEKFRRNAARILAPGACDAITHAVEGLPAASGLDALSRALRP